MKSLALLLLLGACNPKEIGAGWGLDLTFLPYIDGNVYQCTSTTFDEGACPDAQDGVCQREICADIGPGQLAREMGMLGFGTVRCVDTPRHAGPCTMICNGDDLPPIGGCNAFNGCWCE